MCRSALVALVAAALLAMTAAVAFAADPPSPDGSGVPPITGSGQAEVNDDPCSSLPGVDVGGIDLGPGAQCDAAGTAVDTAKKGTHAVTHPKETIEKGIEGVTSGVGGSILDQVASWMGEGASWLLKQTATLIDKSTSPHVTARWFSGQYGRMVVLAALLAIPMLIFAALQSVAKSDARIVAKAWLIQAPLAFLFTAIALVVVDQLLAVSDGMSEWVAQATAQDAQKFLTSVSKVFVVGDAVGVTRPTSTFVMAIGALIAVMGAFVVWLELVLREAAIYIVLAFLPICLMGMIWPKAAHWAKRSVELLVSLVFAKFAIVAILSLAGGALEGGARAGDFAAVLAGAAAVLLAAFSPWALMKLIPAAEAAVSGAGGMRQAAPTGGTIMPTPAQAMMGLMQRSRGAGGGGGGSGSGAAKAAGGGRSAGGGGASGAAAAAAPVAVMTGAAAGAKRAAESGGERVAAAAPNGGGMSTYTRDGGGTPPAAPRNGSASPSAAAPPGANRSTVAGRQAGQASASSAGNDRPSSGREASTGGAGTAGPPAAGPPRPPNRDALNGGSGNAR